MTKWISGVDGRELPRHPVIVAIDGKLQVVQPLGYSLIIDPALDLAAFAPFKVAPPLMRVWGFDDPTDPIDTVELAFADEETARASVPQLLVGYVAPVEPQPEPAPEPAAPAAEPEPTSAEPAA